MNHARNAAGFTLIELIIVAAMIATLAALALPAYRMHTAKADIGNAIGSLAGEKIKVGENHASGTAPCLRVATNLGASGRCLDGVLTGVSVSGRSLVTLTPDLGSATAGKRIDWTCAVVTSIDGRFDGQSCDALN